MKLLFICTTDVKKVSYGGSQCTNRNYLSFCELLGEDNVDVINVTTDLNDSIKSRTLKWLNYLRGFSRGLSRSIISDVISLSQEYEYIFIDSSEYGVLNYRLKKKNVRSKIICFFHNAEFNIKLQELKANPFNFWRFLLLYYNESKAFRYSDKVVALNQRDSDELNRIYNKKGPNKIDIIPISFIDKYSAEINLNHQELTSTTPTCVFIGHYWYANIHGLKWFIENVLEHVNIKLQVVGKGLDVVNSGLNSSKVEFLGFVPDLAALIGAADFVVVPIFKGSGMKVKTCEALMYGKNIVGTKEAFEGYEIDYKKAGAICNTEEEFIEALTYFEHNRIMKFNEYSRACFLEKYSFQATLANFKKLIFAPNQ